MSDDLMKELEKLLAKASPRILKSVQTRSRISEAKVYFDIKPLSSTFKVIRIGSHDWIEYWKAHPEQQEEMLEWKRYITKQLNDALRSGGLIGEGDEKNA